MTDVLLWAALTLLPDVGSAALGVMMLLLSFHFLYWFKGLLHHD